MVGELEGDSTYVSTPVSGGVATMAAGNLALDNRGYEAVLTAQAVSPGTPSTARWTIRTLGRRENGTEPRSSASSGASPPPFPTGARVGYRLAMGRHPIFACCVAALTLGCRPNSTTSAPVEPEPVASRPPDDIKSDAPADFAAIEAAIDAPTYRVEFTLDATGAVEAKLRGVLHVTPETVGLKATGSFAGQLVELEFTDDGERMRGRNVDRAFDLPHEPQVRDAIAVGLARMGLLHNVAQLVSGRPPEHASGGVRDWVKAENVRFARTVTEVEPLGEDVFDAPLSFELVVGGEPSGARNTVARAGVLAPHRTAPGNRISRGADARAGNVRLAIRSMTARPIAAFLVLAALTACNEFRERLIQDDAPLDPASPKAAAEAPPPAEVDPAPLGWYGMPELGIQVEVPGPANHSEVIIGAYSLTAPGCAFQITKGEMKTDTYEDIIAITERNFGNNTVDAFSKNKKNGDGTYLVEWTWEAKYGRRWYVVDRISVAGSQFECREDAMESAEHAACVSHACASAKKL